MSSPAIKFQSKVRVSCQAIGEIKEEIVMKLTKQIREGKNFLSQESGTIKTGKAIRGLAVGVLILAGTGMYFGTIVGGDKDGHTSAETNQEINEPNGVITTGSEPFLKWQRSYFPGVDRLDDQIAAELEACEAYRTFLPDYVDEEGNPGSSERTTAFPPGGWHDWYSHPAALALPGIDRLDDQIAAGLEACEAYRPILPNYVDEGNSASSE